MRRELKDIAEKSSNNATHRCPEHEQQTKDRISRDKAVQLQKIG
jgi:hypothetical protein